MKKKLVALAIAVIAAALMSACIDGVPANPFLQAPIKTDETPARPPRSAAYTIVIDMIDNEQGDTLTASPESGGEGDRITLEFTVANIAHYNLLDFGGVSAPIDSVDSAGSGTRTYTINADDAFNDNIIIIAAFEHTDLIPDPITFTDTSPIITKTYGSANFTNPIYEEHRGIGAVTYSSSDEDIAEVDNNGEVRILAAGSAVITAHKAADAVYAHASASYTLIIEPLAVTLTVTVDNKIYDHTLNAAVTGTTINGNLDGENLTVVAGTAVFANANAGNNKTVTFSGWSFGGSAAGNYTLSAQPASTTANIIKADPVVTWPTGLTATYGQTLVNISLSGNGSGSPAGAFTWTTPSNSVGDLGTQSHSMTFTPNDTTNYNTLTQNVSIVVQVDMVWVPGGSFQMGNPDSSVGYSYERPVHTVTLSGFYMGKYEVTQGQYRSVMGSNPSSSYGVGDNYPAYHVSWYDAVEFCNALSEMENLTPYYTINKTTSDPNNTGTVDPYKWLVTTNTAANGYRLPTEAQWEYAARGGNGSPGNYLYAGSNTVGDVAWYSGNSWSGMREVGTKAPNGLGIYDMSGNAWEWCWDWYGSYSSGAQSDPAGASSGYSRIFRGGAWSNEALIVRSAYRDGGGPSDRIGSFGFRVVRPGAAVAAATYTLTVNRSPAAGGTDSVNGNANPSGAAAFTAGTVVSLMATANNGYTFTGWSVTGGSVASASSASTTITMSGDATVTASFQQQGTVPVSVDMVWVPGGSFQMGDDGYAYSRPAHTVTLTGFYMGKYEVTQKQWYEVMGTTQQELQTAAAPANSTDYGKGDNNPVYYVSWYDAVEFCNALSESEGLTPYYTINKTTGSDPDNSSLISNDPYRWLVTRNTSATGYRLPTEAQWEYAAKGGDGSPGNYTHAGSNNADEVAWYNNNDGRITKEVGTKAPNGLGIYDLSGNVWEWCWDWYSVYEDSEQTDPAGPSAGRDRVLRGGGWDGTADSVRSAYRGAIYPSVRGNYRGFRVVRP